MIDDRIIFQMMELAELSYQTTQPVFADTKLNVIDDDKTGIQCMIRQKRNVLTIAFRGTDSWKDMLTNLQFSKMRFIDRNNEIRVHSGFLSRYEKCQIRKCIHFYVTDQIDTIRLTGHSYGAALAALCAVDLQIHFPQKDYEVFLFGCPRMGNKEFATFYNNRIFKTLRFENGNDFVTKIPLRIFGYCHIGTKIHIGKTKRMGAFSLSQHSCRAYHANLLEYFR